MLNPNRDPATVFVVSLNPVRAHARPGASNPHPSPPEGAGRRFHREFGVVKLDADIPSEDFGLVWEADDPDSFVVCLGWCRRRGDAAPRMGVQDLRFIHEEHRRLGAPPLNELSGTFCLLAYDHGSGSFWVACDAWAIGGFFYGIDAGGGRLLVSNRAGIVANECASPLDGTSYLAWLREASIPPGRTLFSGVHRIPLRKALKVDSRTGRASLVPWRGLPEPQEAWSYKESYQRLKEVVAFCIPKSVSDPRTVIDLTAGNDSRVTVAGLIMSRRPSAPSPAYNFRVVGGNDHADLAGAKTIAGLMGWNLTHHLPIKSDEIPEELFASSAVRGDTTYRFHAIAGRLVRERRDWPDIRFHVGSLGGHLIRNWMWQYEMLRPIHGTHVRTKPLLLHRLHNYPDIDFARISGGSVDLAAHDDHLLEGARAIDEQAPGLLDLYKLERIHLQTLSSTIFWCLSGQLNVTLPYLWAEMTDVTLQIPWRHKRTRALVLDLVRDCVPSLCGIPTDTGAPFRRLTPASAMEYFKYVTQYGLAIARTHYRPGAIGMPAVLGRSLPDAWIRRNHDLSSLGSPYDIAPVLGTVDRKQGQGLSRTEASEFEVLLHCRLLLREYPRIRFALDFKSPAGDLSETEIQIFPTRQSSI